MWYQVLIYLFVIGRISPKRIEYRLIQLDQGPLRGYKDSVEDIFAFYGIPYARAPTGPDKFKAPLPSPSWSKTLDAIDKEIICPQHNYFGTVTNTTTMQEDCLIVNVFIPNTNKIYLPVIVYIHGGAFLHGYGNMSKLKKLASSKRVIVITFNYRLGPHGFLCLGTKDIPGNGGMKDQVALLRWVQKNIRHFGGNPNDVTIDGCSAGGASVGLLMISKLANGLFSKVIQDSGDITSAFSVQVNSILNAIEYAKLLNFNDVENVYTLEGFFKNASYELLISPEMSIEYPTYFVTPCVEKYIGEERFLDEDPVSIITKRRAENVTVLKGFTNMDGLIEMRNFNAWSRRMNTHFEDFLPPDLSFKSKEEKNRVVRDIRTFYFGDKAINNETILSYVNFFTDTIFACPTLRTIKLLLKMGNKNIYLYEYSYVDEMTPFVPYTNVKGAGHCAQSDAIFDDRRYDRKLKNENLHLIKSRNWKIIMRDIWLNFITLGIPKSFGIPPWIPVHNNGFPYMSLKQNPEMRKYHINPRCCFWDKIYEKYYQKRVPPDHSIQRIHD